MQMATFKAATTTGTSVYADLAYAPYGETYAASGASDVSFTGQNNDTVSNLYDFLFREYHPVQGRWISPDPAGMAAVDPMNPESWNRYAYVGNSPLTATDANGLVTLPGCEEGDFGCGGGLDPGCGMWGGPEGDICTLLLPVIGRWGGGGGGSGSGGSGGGGGTDNGGPPVQEEEQAAPRVRADGLPTSPMKRIWAFPLVSRETGEEFWGQCYRSTLAASLEHACRASKTLVR